MSAVEKKTARKTRRWSRRRIVLWTVVALAVVFGAIQLVPYGRDHTDPPATNDFTWSSGEAEAIARESCYDCHSSETDWWWATNIAPFSWLVQRDVDEGREHLDFSAWNGDISPEGLAEAVNEGMPPIQYVIIHWGARLSDAEKKTLVYGFAASLAKSFGSCRRRRPPPMPPPLRRAATRRRSPPRAARPATAPRSRSTTAPTARPTRPLSSKTWSAAAPR